jgi:NAD-dependent dihydropyrimidine dehydrogenase PreA subunit
MKKENITVIPETSGVSPLTFDPAVCNGCNRCVEVCQVDILAPNPEKGSQPVVLFPDECWYGGCCVDACPKPGAIKLNIPLMNRVQWKRVKE